MLPVAICDFCPIKRLIWAVDFNNNNRRLGQIIWLTSFSHFLLVTGIAHRDLKPENILCVHGDEVLFNATFSVSKFLKIWHMKLLSLAIWIGSKWLEAVFLSLSLEMVRSGV